VRPVIAQHRDRLHRLCVGPRAGLREAERRHQLAARAARQEALLLIFRTKQDNALAADRLMRAKVDAERRVRAANLAEDSVVHLGRRAETAVFLRNAQAHHAKLVESLSNAVRKRAIVIELRAVDAFRRERADRIENHAQ
jgi:hypothetical protein